jgi:hypothetical protein
MKVSDLTVSEKKVWEAAATGALVDLRVGDRDLDSPERWAKWGKGRIIRAEVIAALLIGDGEAASAAIRGVRLQGARITGDLNLEATTLRCPLALLDCSFANALNFDEATALSVRLSGSHIPTVRAKQLRTRGDLQLNEGFSVSGGVDLAGAHIGGILDCTGSQFANSDGPALNADSLTVDQDMYCREGFSASGEVILLGAHIGGQLDCTGGQFANSEGPALNADNLTVDRGMYCREGFSASGEVILRGAHIGGVLACTGGQFSNPGGAALNADRLTVDGSMFCGEGFSASGEVRLAGAHIGGQLSCTGGQFSNPGGTALNADGLTVDQDMFCDEGFVATGQVRLPGVHIGGVLACTGGQFSNPGGTALNADGLTVDQDMFCREGFSASGEVNLDGAHIGGQLDCTGGHFSNPDGSALNLEGATVSGPLFMESAVVQGSLNLIAAKASSYYDNQATWPQTLRLDGFVYDAIEGASAKERLKWLRRNETGYSPQIYEQLAAVYRRSGHDEDARRILIAKQRRRSAQGNLAGKLGGFLLDWTVGYGYRTWLAALWLVGLLALGTYLFGYAYRGDLTPASKTNVPPPFQPFLYTLDLLLPVASLHQRDGWVAHGAAQWLSAGFIVMGWILATAVVLSLTGLLKRD